ncbi:MAG: hypothetical protein AB8B69_07990 [Chitinophagales bacterium]
MMNTNCSFALLGENCNFLGLNDNVQSEEIDTIYSLEAPPDLEFCIEEKLQKYNLVFHFGEIDDLVNNYETIQKYEGKYGEGFYKLLLGEFSCSKKWKKYLRTMVGKMKSKSPIIGRIRNYKVKYRAFGLIAQYQAETLHVNPGGGTKVSVKVLLDEKGDFIVNERKEERVRL